MYQGGSDSFIGPNDDIEAGDEAWGIDFEGEIGVIVDDVPMGISPEAARRHIKLVTILNDVSLRNLIVDRAGQGLRLLPRQARHGLRAGRRHARRAGRCLGRRAGSTCR